MTDIREPFQKYKDDVYRLALSYTKSTADAEDICQSAFLKLMQSSVTPGREKAWLMQVTANLCRNLLRSSWWRRSEPLEEAIPVQIPAHQADICQAVMALEPKYRVVVYLHYYGEYSTRDIAALLHISQSAVTTRLSRAREMLKNALKEDDI